MASHADPFTLKPEQEPSRVNVSTSETPDDRTSPHDQSPSLGRLTSHPSDQRIAPRRDPVKIVPPFRFTRITEVDIMKRVTEYLVAYGEDLHPQVIEKYIDPVTVRGMFEEMKSLVKSTGEASSFILEVIRNESETLLLREKARQSLARRSLSSPDIRPRATVDEPTVDDPAHHNEDLCPDCGDKVGACLCILPRQTTRPSQFNPSPAETREQSRARMVMDRLDPVDETLETEDVDITELPVFMSVRLWGPAGVLEGGVAAMGWKDMVYKRYTAPYLSKSGSEFTLHLNSTLVHILEDLWIRKSIEAASVRVQRLLEGIRKRIIEGATPAEMTVYWGLMKHSELSATYQKIEEEMAKAKPRPKNGQSYYQTQPFRGGYQSHYQGFYPQSRGGAAPTRGGQSGGRGAQRGRGQTRGASASGAAGVGSNAGTTSTAAT